MNVSKTSNSAPLNNNTQLLGSLPHSPIIIDGNANLAASIDNTGGGGTSWGDAVILEDFEINANLGPTCIRIMNTDLYLIIRNCTLENASVFGGIRLENCSNVLVENCAFNDNINLYFIRCNFARDIYIATNYRNRNAGSVCTA